MLAMWRMFSGLPSHSKPEPPRPRGPAQPHLGTAAMVAILGGGLKPLNTKQLIPVFREAFRKGGFGPDDSRAGASGLNPGLGPAASAGRRFRVCSRGAARCPRA